MLQLVFVLRATISTQLNQRFGANFVLILSIVGSMKSLTSRINAYDSNCFVSKKSKQEKAKQKQQKKNRSHKKMSLKKTESIFPIFCFLFLLWFLIWETIFCCVICVVCTVFWT